MPLQMKVAVTRALEWGAPTALLAHRTKGREKWADIVVLTPGSNSNADALLEAKTVKTMTAQLSPG